jgi:hypothetical protein
MTPTAPDAAASTAAAATPPAHTPATKSGKKARRSLLHIQPAITKETPTKKHKKKCKKAKQQTAGEPCKGQRCGAASGIAKPSAGSNRMLSAAVMRK